MSKHTPGPWVYREELRARWSAIESRDFIVAGIQNESDSEDLDVQRANARLIAAAPDMLEALQELMAWQNGPPLITWTEGWTAAMKQAEAALAAATGDERRKG